MRRAAIPVAMAVLWAGCSLDSAGTGNDVDLIDAITNPTDTGVTDSGAIVADAGDALIFETDPDATPDTIDAGCPAAKAGAKPCDEIPAREALASGQVLDGKSDDFCDVPYVDFDNTKGAIRVPTMMPAAASATMRIRVAWSSFGLHAHLSVKDSTPMPHTAADPSVFLGDSIEIYVAGHDTLSGAFDGATKDVGAQQIVFSAPGDTSASRATYFYMGSPSGSPPSLLWFARKTAGGYEIELRIPWADLKSASLPNPTAGKRIALAWALNNKYSSDPQAFAVFQVKSPYPTPTSCPSPDPQPFCDDRLWCTPLLAP